MKEKKKKIKENSEIEVKLSLDNVKSNSVMEQSIFQEKEVIDPSDNQILMYMLTDKDIYLKSDIENVRAFTILQLIQKYELNLKIKKGAELLDIYIYWALRYALSKHRESRKETYDSLKYRKEAKEKSKMSLKDLLTSNLNDIE